MGGRRFTGRMVVCILACLPALLPASGLAQTSAEVWLGMAVGSHSGTAAGLDMAPAASYGVTVSHVRSAGLVVFAGFFRTGFGCEDGFCQDQDLTVVGRHGAVGVELRRGGPWLRLGVLGGTTEVGSDGDSPELGLGALLAGGFTIGSGRLRFLPGISYRWMSANTSSSNDHAVAVTLDLGVRFRLSPE